jgi:ATP-dependent Clp protease ATP-binding subunit ClpX
MSSPKCSFCGESVNRVRKLILSPNQEHKICNECVGVCIGILKDDREKDRAGRRFTVTAPQPTWLERFLRLR